MSPKMEVAFLRIWKIPPSIRGFGAPSGTLDLDIIFEFEVLLPQLLFFERFPLIYLFNEQWLRYS
jgi:hypothetical protein